MQNHLRGYSQGCWTISFATFATLLGLWLLGPSSLQAQYTCTTNSGGLTITSYNGPGGWLTVPSRINSQPVTSIGDGAFHSHPEINVVTLPPGITNIGAQAFANCSSLYGVVMPTNIPNLPDKAFYQCFQLTGITLPNTITNIGQLAFYSCSSLQDVQLPDSVRTLGNGAFQDCWRLGNVQIGNGLKTISSSAFSGCTVLTNVVFGISVTNIAAGAFSSCPVLRKIVLPASLKSLEEYAFSDCSRLRSIYFLGSAPSLPWASYSVFSQGTVYYLPGTTGWSNTYAYLPAIPWNPSAGLLSVRSNTFAFQITGNENLAVVVEAATNLAHPVWVTVATNTLVGGSSWFRDAAGTNSRLKFYRFAAPGPVEYDYVITNGSITLTRYTGTSDAVELPDSIDGLPVTVLSQFLFWDNRLQPTQVKVPDSVVTIDALAFASCTSLTNVILGNSIRSLESGAFSGCTALARIDIPAAVTNIALDAFDSTSLTQINVNSGNIVYSSIAGVLFDKSAKTLWKYPRARTGNYTIPSGVTAIGSMAFEYCGGLSNIVFPATLKSIGNNAFASCTGLQRVSFPNTLSSIEDCAFNYCPGLSNVVIPDSVTNLGSYAFAGCLSVTNVSISHSLSELKQGVFAGCYKLVSASIPQSVTDIRSSAFEDCHALTNLQFGTSLRTIGSNSFASCYSLKTVSIPAIVTNMDCTAFLTCGSLSAISVNSNNPVYHSQDGIVFTDNRSNLFRCPEGKTGGYDVPEGVTQISPYAFANSELTNLTLPNSLLAVAELSFYQCHVPLIGIPDNVQNIAPGAFCSASVASITIGNSVTNIDTGAFMMCEALTNVVIGSGLKYLHEDAIGYCWYLKSIYFKGDAPVGDAYAFDNSPVTIFYVPGTSGWGAYFCGKPTATWNP